VLQNFFISGRSVFGDRDKIQILVNDRSHPKGSVSLKEGFEKTKSKAIKKGDIFMYQV
jgi:hypothetical protein